MIVVSGHTSPWAPFTPGPTHVANPAKATGAGSAMRTGAGAADAMRDVMRPLASNASGRSVPQYEVRAGYLNHTL